MGEHKKKEATEKLLNEEVSLTLKRRQWLVVHNVLVSLKYGLGDAKIINQIVDQLQPIAAIDSNIERKEDPEEGIITN